MWMLTFLLILCVLYLYYRKTFKKYEKINEQFPGPVGLPILGNAFDILQNSEAFYKWIRDAMILYRRSFRIWLFNMPYIGLVEPKYVELILNNTVHLEKSDLYDSLIPWLGRGLLTSYGSRWKRSRKTLTPAFHFKILENITDIFFKNADLLCEELDKFAQVGKTLNVYEPVKLCALDNICESAMGTQINAQKCPDSEYVNAIKEICSIAFLKATQPWSRFPFIFNLTNLGKREGNALKIIHGKTRQVIDQKIDELQNNKEKKTDEENELNLKKRKCFIDILLECLDVEGGLSYSEIQEEVDTFMFEGHDTITSAVSFALYNLANNPECQEKAYQELVTILGKNLNCLPTNAELNEMKYLEMIIKESLRLHPSVPIIGRVVAEDLYLDKHTMIPKGTQVIVLITNMHRNPDIWDKPDEFNPEHFSQDSIINRNPYSFIPFSAGPRNCIGMRFAMLEMKVTLSTILRRFILTSSGIDLRLATDVVLVSTCGVPIRLQKRII